MASPRTTCSRSCVVPAFPFRPTYRSPGSCKKQNRSIIIDGNIYALEKNKTDRHDPLKACTLDSRTTKRTSSSLILNGKNDACGQNPACTKKIRACSQCGSYPLLFTAYQPGYDSSASHCTARVVPFMLICHRYVVTPGTMPRRERRVAGRKGGCTNLLHASVIRPSTTHLRRGEGGRVKSNHGSMTSGSAVCAERYASPTNVFHRYQMPATAASSIFSCSALVAGSLCPKTRCRQPWLDGGMQQQQ